MNKCYRCLFEDEYYDMGASVPVCNRRERFDEAIEAHSDPNPCKWHITLKEVIALQEKMNAKEETLNEHHN